ncbi:MAG: Ig-like domain-containing protein [Prevotella sp.]|nr:Ig-like domain-containing protein [Prevotella sp.]
MKRRLTGLIKTLVTLMMIVMGGNGAYGIDIYSYTMQGDVIGGNVSFGSNASGDSYKIDNNSKYVCVTLQEGVTLQAGDIITVTGYAQTSATDLNFKLKSSTSATESAYTTSITTKNTDTELTYTVTNADCLTGHSTLYIYRNETSIFFKSVKITRANAVSLLHTGSTNHQSGTYYCTLDAEQEYYNQDRISMKDQWNGQAVMKFSFVVPQGMVVTDATLTWSTIVYGTNVQRDNKLYYLNSGVDADWDALSAGTSSMLGTLSKTYLTNKLLLGNSTEHNNISTDVSAAIRNLSTQGYVVFLLTGCNSGANLYGYGSATKKPTLTITLAKADEVLTVTYNTGTKGTSVTKYDAMPNDDITAVTLPDVTPNSNQVFTGWYTAASGGTFVGDANSSYTPTGNITLYAHYVENVTTSNIIGSTDRRVAMGKSYSQPTRLNAGDTYSFTFNNYGSDGRNSVSATPNDNWVMSVGNSTSTLTPFLLSASRYWWNTSESGYQTFTPTTNDDYYTYLSALPEGVPVKVNVNFDGTYVNVEAKTTYNGVTYTISGQSPEMPDEIKTDGFLYIWFTVQNAYINNFQARKVSSDATVAALTVNNLTLTPDGSTYSYSIGKAYGKNTIDVTVTPNDAGAVISTSTMTTAAGEDATLTATIGTPLTFTITAGDEVTTAEYTIDITRAEDINIAGNTFTVIQQNYYDGQRIVCTDLTAWISTTATGSGRTYLNTNTGSITGASATEYTRYMMCDNGTNPTYNSSTGMPTAGMYYAFQPTKSGNLEVAVQLSAGKTFCVSDGTNPLTYGNGEGEYTTSPALNANNQLDTDAPMYATIPVEAGKTYYIYATGTKMGLYGFCFYNDQAENITISGISTVGVNRTTQLTANVLPSSTTNKTVTWSSADNTIATVNASGIVTGVADGEVEITATATDGSGVTGTYTVTVVTRTYTYTVNAVDSNGKLLKEIKSGTYIDGSGAMNVAYPKYVLIGNTLYETNKNDENYYRRSITPDADDYAVNITYTAAVENVVFYTEAEDIAELTNRPSYDAVQSRTSNAAIASRLDNRYISITTLKPGKYTIYAAALHANGNKTFTYNFNAGETEVMSTSVTSGTVKYANSTQFSITEDTQITLSCNCNTTNTGGLDYFYIVQEPIYYVTENMRQFDLLKENIDANTYTSANPVDKNGNSYNSRNGISGLFYNIKNINNYITITENGALAFSVDAFHGNASETRQIRVYVDDVEKVSFNIVPGEYTTSPILALGDNGTHTIKITGNGKDVYPADIVFYTEPQVPQLNFTSAAVKVGETKEFTLSVPTGCTLNSMIDAGDNKKVVATFTNDPTNERKGTLTLTGLQTTGESPTNVTFSITGNGTSFSSGTSTIVIEVMKAGMTLAYSDGDSDPTVYQCDADEETPSLPSITLTATDENGNDILLSSLSMSYTSDDPTIATVSNTGVISLVPNGSGSAVITATAKSNTYEDATAQYTITLMRGITWKTNEEKFKDTPPAIRDTFHIYKNVEDEEVLYLVGTFGGWDRNGGVYRLPGSANDLAPDSWEDKSNTQTPVDGFRDYRSGKNNAVNESMYSSLEKYYNSEIYGAERFGWFKQPDGDTTYPFTLPVRGAYMTFEPEVNGTLSIYIEQNGAWNSSKKDIYDNEGNFISTTDGTTAVTFPGTAPFQFRPHAFFLVDQNGMPVENKTKLNVITRQKIGTTLSSDENSEVLRNFCANYGCEPGEKFKCIIDPDADGYNDVTNIGNWKEFKEYMSPAEQQRVHENWASGVNGAQGVTKLDNGAYLVVDKSLVKYTFHVIAGQTFYIFSNFSKLGFAGCNFIPDEENQPSDTLALSEDEAYNPLALKSGDNINTIPMYETITLDRSFTANKWNTICLPFTMTEREVENVFGNGTELIILDRVNVDEGHAQIFMTYHEIQNILAGYPYLIKPTQNVDSIEVHNKGIDPAQQVMEFTNNGYTSKGVTGFCTPQTFNIKGTDYSASVLLNTGDIFLSGNTLYLSRGTSMLKGYRSYLKKEDDGSAPAKSVSFNYFKAWEDEEEATAINVCEMSDEALDSFETKTMNGVFSVTGQKVSDTLNGLTKGIYIFNGRKVIVK